jgi:hypothetical protein
MGIYQIILKKCDTTFIDHITGRAIGLKMENSENQCK